MHIATKKKIGRPTDSIKDTLFRVRLNKESANKLEKAAEILDTSRSDVIRIGIDKVYDEAQK